MINVETTPLYAVSHHIINFPNGSADVLIWNTPVIKNIGMVASSISWISYHLCHIEMVRASNRWSFSRRPGRWLSAHDRSFSRWIYFEHRNREEHPSWLTYFDGAIHVHGNRIRAILISQTSPHSLMATKLRFPYTNNMAKNKACVDGLKAAMDMNVKDLKVCGDSILIISQSRGELEVRSQNWPNTKGYLTKLNKVFLFSVT